MSFAKTVRPPTIVAATPPRSVHPSKGVFFDRDRSVDAIATDHAPHHYDEKKVEFDRAPFGIIGLETAIPLSLDRLVHTGVIRLSRLVELLSMNPAGRSP